MKKIYKYATGAEIPENAIYLNTVTQTHRFIATSLNGERYEPCYFVWHYFLVEIKND